MQLIADAEASVAVDQEIGRLRSALAGTAESPRRMIKMEWPLEASRLIDEQSASGLRSAAVLVPVIRYADGARLVLTRRSESMRQHKGQISFPGGSRDPGDASFAAAALREAHEEIGLPPASVEVIGFLDDHPTFTGYRITPVVGIVNDAFVPLLEAAEVAELFELPLARVLAADGFERKTLHRDGIDLPFFEINHGPYRIWGATAAILWALRRKLLAAA